jgi:hypothetical protein
MTPEVFFCTSECSNAPKCPKLTSEVLKVDIFDSMQWSGVRGLSSSVCVVVVAVR